MKFISRSMRGTTLCLSLLSLVTTIILLIWTLNNRMASYSFRPSALQCQQNNSTAVRVAVLNRHRGTGHDFSIVAKHLNFDYTEYPPEQFTVYGQSEQDANFLNQKLGFGDHLCNCYDYVVVIDTIPDARFLLQRLLEDSNDPANKADHCKLKKVVMVVTNRFDWAVIDETKYFNTIKRVQNEHKGKVVWIGNNPWEQTYADLRMGGHFLDFTLIRPYGSSFLPAAKKIPDELSKYPVILNHSNTVILLSQMLRNVGIEYKLLPQKYGGPTVLSQYKAFISIPYQASTMKMYENIANGVLMLVPTPRLLRILFHQPYVFLQDVEATFMAGEDNWYKNIELYSDDLKKFFRYFDSPEELKMMLKLSKEELWALNGGQNGVEYWKVESIVRTEKWRSVIFGDDK